MHAVRITSAAFLVAAACSGAASTTKSKDTEQEPIVYEDIPGANTEEPPVEEPPVEEPPPPPAPPDLHGTWVGACLAGPGTDHHRLTFVITDVRWDLDYQVFADAGCTRRKVAIELGGGYEILAASETVPGAWEANFSFESRTVTADDAKTAKAIGKLCSVKLKAKKPADVHANGCPKLGLLPADACPTDHDLVAIERDQLYFGVRPADNDMCTPEKRPTALVDAAAAAGFQWPSMGVAECDGYLASARSWVTCDKIPVADARGLFDGARQIADQYGPILAGGDPEARQQIADSCKQGDDATKSALQAFGCTAAN
jgi:hypothetical protein